MAGTVKEEALKLRKNIDDVYEAGKQAERNDFWDTFQQNGERDNYHYAFKGAGWTVDNFKPKYDIIPDRYNSSTYAGVGVFSATTNFGGNFKEALERQGVILDTQYVRNPTSMFDGATSLQELPHINLSSATTASNVFYGCFVPTISVTLPDRELNYNNCFRTSTLENLEITGTINGTNFNVSYCKNITHDSLMNIINALADKSGDTSGTVWTVTFGSTNIAKLTDEELNIAYEKGWSVN